MRIAAAILLTSAAIDWPALVLDRAGVALLGLACLALAVPAAARRKVAVVERPRGPAIFEGLDELEPELGDAAERVVSYLDNRRETV